VASKSAQQEPEKAEVVEEALDLLDQTLDRVKVLYEQYFLGIQKQAPQYLHTDVERKLRDIAQLQIRNTALRYRFVTLQQKFGAYNAYWRRTVRQIENGKYVRNLSKLSRQAAQSGEEIPEEILAAMPKRMREQVKRDREAALAMASRRHQTASDDEPELTYEHDELDPPTDRHRKPTPMTVGGAHVIDEADGDLDLDAFFADMAKNPTRPPPIANPTPAHKRASTSNQLARAREREKTGNLPVVGRTKTHSSSPSGAHAVVSDPTQPSKRAPTSQPTQPTPAGGQPTVRAPVVRSEHAKPTAMPVIGRSDTEQDLPNLNDLDPPTDRHPVTPARGPMPARPPPTNPTTAIPRVPMPAHPMTAIPRPPMPAQTSTPRQPPTNPTTAIPRMPRVPEPRQTTPMDVTFNRAPSQVTRPNPVIPGSAASQKSMPVQTLSGPFPAAKTPAPQPNVPRPAPRAPVGRAASTPVPQRVTPPGMTDADVNALYAKYVKAKEMVGQTAGPGAYGKLLQTINSQAPKIMEQYKAKGVDFSVVVKDNQVIIRAKPKP
jgi:hypothetical protein